MKPTRISHIVLVVLAVLSAAVLFTTYGTVLLSAPFVHVQLDEPSSADSDGAMTVIADSGSSRALILNADKDLTGVIGCATTESPIDAITDASVSDGVVYLAGVQFEADSDAIKRERVVAYDKGGHPAGHRLRTVGRRLRDPFHQGDMRCAGWRGDRL